MSAPRAGGKRGPGRTANIFDVARLAGVSHQTVSRVINDLPNVRPATRARVEQAIAQLQYSPSPAARALVTRRTRTIGLVDPGHLGLRADVDRDALQLRRPRRALQRRVGQRAVATTRRRSARSSRACCASGSTRSSSSSSTSPCSSWCAASTCGIPVVAAASTARRSPLIVSIDQYRGARAAVRHLAELGHTRILHLAGPRNAPDAIERVARLARRARRAPPRDRRPRCSATGRRRAATGSAPSWTSSPASAVFVGNDHMSIGLLSALRERGLRVPEDVSVVGFDDVPEAGYLFPPLTTVRQDFGTLGELIMQKVLIAVEEPDTATEDTPLPTHLILRQSTRAVR